MLMTIFQTNTEWISELSNLFEMSVTNNYAGCWQTVADSCKKKMSWVISEVTSIQFETDKQGWSQLFLRKPVHRRTACLECIFLFTWEPSYRITFRMHVSQLQWQDLEVNPCKQIESIERSVLVEGLQFSIPLFELYEDISMQKIGKMASWG